MPPLPTLTCKECGYVNEIDRIYCHGCGAKLDRSALIAQQQKHTVSREQKQREVRRMMTPGGGSFTRGLKTLVKTVAWAAVAAVLIEAARPPEGVPAMPKRGEIVEVPQLDAALEQLAAAPAGQAIALSETQINAYLGRKTFNKVPAWLTSLVPLRRTFVNLEPNLGRLTLQADLVGYPIYIGLSGRLKIERDAGMKAACEGGYIGRLQIPAFIAQYAGAALPVLMDSVKHEQQLLGQLGAVEIQKGQIKLVSRGPVSPATSPAPSAAGGRPVGR